MGVDLDFEIHTDEHYINIYKELLKDPDNRLTLRRYGISKHRESGKVDERFSSKKRFRGSI